MGKKKKKDNNRDWRCASVCGRILQQLLISEHGYTTNPRLLRGIPNFVFERRDESRRINFVVFFPAEFFSRFKLKEGVCGQHMLQYKILDTLSRGNALRYVTSSSPYGIISTHNFALAFFCLVFSRSAVSLWTITNRCQHPAAS